MSTEDIFGGAFTAGASKESKPAEAEEIEAARQGFNSFVKEVLRPEFMEVGKEIAAQGNGFEVRDSDDAERPSISLMVRIKGEEYRGKVEPSCLTYEFDPRSLKVRQGGWIMIPSKRNYVKVLAVALVDSDRVTREGVRRRALSFVREIHELTVAEDSFIHTPVGRKL